VVVRVNDRLPKKSSRTIDLTKAAARKLNFIKSGLTQVYIEELVEY
jgi:rare lipoprotein A